MGYGAPSGRSCARGRRLLSSKCQISPIILLAKTTNSIARARLCVGETQRERGRGSERVCVQLHGRLMDPMEPLGPPTLARNAPAD